MYEKELKIILSVIKSKRLQSGYSQMFVAEKLGITQNVYSKMEASKIQLTVCRLSMICDILDINIIELMRSVQ